MPVECNIEDDRWIGVDLLALAERAVAASLARLGYAPADWDVSVMGCSDARIAQLNADFRGKSAATNVLSWPSMDRAAATKGAPPAPPVGDPELGDIALAFETCKREASDLNRDFAHHTLHLLVHGTLHLLGYDHETDLDAELMESLEIDILRDLGVSNPYI